MIDEPDFKSLLAALPRFSASQRAELTKKLKASAQFENPAQEPLGGSDWLFQGICVALQQKGLLSRSSASGLIHTKGYKKYLTARESVMKELELLLPARDRSQARLALGQLVGVALIKWCSSRGPYITIGPGAVLANAEHAIEALELCYPGYIEANLFYIVLTGFKHEDGK